MNLYQKIKVLLASSESLEDLAAKLDSIETQVKYISDNLEDASKLMDLVSKKELAASEYALFKTETDANDLATLEEINEEIDHLTAMKTSYDTSPAIGSRMIRSKNSQITEVNRKLQQLHAKRARMTNEQN